MALTLEQAIAKSKAYGRGEIPITSLPPQPPHKSQSGMCDYCNKIRPVVLKTKNNMYLVCWTDVCRLTELYGEDWEKKAENTLSRNHQNRLQTDAQKASNKKGGVGAAF